jgi:hypothetical protein
MARMPVVPDDWFADGLDTGMKPLPLAPLSEPPVMTNLPYRPDQLHGTGLTLLMEPHELASVDGLPDHIREGLGDYASQSSRDATKQPAGYASAASRPEEDDKIEHAAKGTGILGHVMEGWDVLNHGVGLFLGQEGADMLGKVAGPAATALGPIEHAGEAYAETSGPKHAPEFPTWAGAAGKSAAGLWGAGAGAATGAVVGGLVGGPFMEFTIPLGAALGGGAADYLSRKVSNQQAGGFIDRMFLNKP